MHGAPCLLHVPPKVVLSVECSHKTYGMPVLFNSVRTGRFFPVHLLHSSQASHSPQSKKKGGKKSFTTETNSNMWLEDNRNVHASAKIKYGNMKMRLLFFLSKRTDSLLIAGNCMGFYFLSNSSQKNKIEKNIHR